MPLELITLKLDSAFKKDLDKTIKEAGYHSRTEFIRSTLREKLEELRMKQKLLSYYGRSKKHVSDKQLHEAGEKALKNLGL